MTIRVTPKMAKVYQVLKENPPWFCTRYIAEQLEYYDPTCVLPQLIRMHEAGLVLRQKFGKGYCWKLADNPPGDVVYQFEMSLDILDSRNAR